MKVNIEKIKSLAKEKGISISYICEKVGMGRGYLNDIKKSNGGDIPDERLTIIIDILNTTIEYLTDNTAIKEKSPSVKTEELSDIDNLILEKFKSLPQERKKEFLDYLNYLLSKHQDN